MRSAWRHLVGVPSLELPDRPAINQELKAALDDVPRLGSRIRVPPDRRIRRDLGNANHSFITAPGTSKRCNGVRLILSLAAAAGTCCAATGVVQASITKAAQSADVNFSMVLSSTGYTRDRQWRSPR